MKAGHIYKFGLGNVEVVVELDEKARRALESGVRAIMMPRELVKYREYFDEEDVEELVKEYLLKYFSERCIDIDELARVNVRVSAVTEEDADDKLTKTNLDFADGCYLIIDVESYEERIDDEEDVEEKLEKIEKMLEEVNARYTHTFVKDKDDNEVLDDEIVEKALKAVEDRNIKSVKAEVFDDVNKTQIDVRHEIEIDDETYYVVDVYKTDKRLEELYDEYDFLE